MTDFGTTPLSDTTIGTNQIPTSAVFVPNTAGGALTAMQGGPASTDGSGFKSAPGAIYVPDGNDVAQGTTTDAANANTVIGQLKQIKSNTASVAVGSLPALPAGTNVIGHVIVDSAGNVSITSLPSLPAGTNVIGHVIVDSGSTSVSGTVTANAGSGTFTNQQSNVQSDYDTGAGTQNMTMFGVALPASGGAVAGGTASNPMRTDPTGTTTQPVSGSVSVSNFPGTQPVSGTVSVNVLPAGSNTIGGVELVDSGGTNKASISAGGAVKVDNSAVTQPISGSVSVSNFPGTQAVSGTVTANQGGAPWAVSQQVASSGGSVPYHNLSAATTNFTNVKGVACQMYGYSLSNTSASAIFVKFYDKATAPGTGDTPKNTVQVPANATVLRAIPEGLKFTTGFGWAATGGVADNDNTAIAANCVIDFNLNS